MEISMRMTPQDKFLVQNLSSEFLEAASHPPLLPHDVLQYAFPFWRREFFLEYPYKANQ